MGWIRMIRPFHIENSDYTRWIPNYHDRPWYLSWLFIDNDRAWSCVKLYQFPAVILQSLNISWICMKFDCNYKKREWLKRLIFKVRTVNGMKLGAFIFPFYNVYIRFGAEFTISGLIRTSSVPDRYIWKRLLNLNLKNIAQTSLTFIYA